MALFGWKKSGTSDGKTATAVDGGSTVGGDGTGDGAGGSGRGKSGDQEFVPQPDKARRWFDYARTAADSANFEYALHCYASGIKLDPEVMSAHESMFEVAVKFMNKGGEAAKGKDIKAVLGDDTHDVAKFAAAEFEWMRDVTNAALATRTLDAAIKANQREYGHWIAPKVLNVLRRGKKLSKGTLVKAKDLFKQVSAWDQALEAGQLAMQMDPTDNALDHELKDLSAQRAMDAGGYEKAVGQEGGFRTFVKDADRQRQLIESEAIVGNQSMEDRNLQRAKAEYEKSPRVPDVINQYAQLVKKKGTPEAEQLASQIYAKGFQDTGEYRFRMAAGDIRLEQLRREYEGYQRRSDENAADANLKAITEAARRSLLDAEQAEYSERVSKYPTDRNLKLRLGEIEFGLGNFESAQRAFQAAKDEPKLRVRAGHMLGRCFAAEGWHMEAISEYKEALAHIDVTEKERELAIRYDLMVSLIEQARSERDSGLAKEALEICSGIVRKDIGYRDIRAKRKDIDQLLKDISGG